MLIPMMQPPPQTRLAESSGRADEGACGSAWRLLGCCSKPQPRDVHAGQLRGICRLFAVRYGAVLNIWSQRSDGAGFVPWWTAVSAPPTLLKMGCCRLENPEPQVPRGKGLSLVPYLLCTTFILTF